MWPRREPGGPPVTELVAPLVDPFRLPFMQRALVELLLLAVVAGVAGVHVVLRRMAFVTDTLTHTIFPGIVVAFLLGQSVLLGALVAGVLSAALLPVLTASRRVAPDAALAVLLTSFFAVGVVLVSRTEGYTSDLTLFLFGDLLSVTGRQIAETVAVGALVLALFTALHKELLLAAFDPGGARAMGYRTVVLDLVLNVLVALTVVAAVRAVGTVLVIALLVVPAVTAQVLTDRLVVMVAVAVGVAALGGWLGLVLSFQGSVAYGVALPAGATVVAVLVALFGAVSVAAGLLRHRRRVTGPVPSARGSRVEVPA